MHIGQDAGASRGLETQLGRVIVGLDMMSRLAIVAGVGALAWNVRDSDYLFAAVASTAIGYASVQLAVLVAEVSLLASGPSESRFRPSGFVVAAGAVPRLAWAIPLILHEHEDHSDGPVVVLAVCTLAVVVAATMHGLDWRLGHSESRPAVRWQTTGAHARHAPDRCNEAHCSMTKDGTSGGRGSSPLE